MNKTLGTICGTLLTAFSINSHAEWSGNIGWASEYIYRGIPQSDSSAYFGIDYENDHFYLGTWAADVGQGAEVDLYLGLTGELAKGIGYQVGATGYFYTDDFDDTYQELNLSLDYGPLSINANIGQYDNFGGPTQDYAFYAIKAEHQNLYLLLGSYAGDFDGEYFETGYGTAAAGLDLSLSLIHGTSRLLGQSDTSIVFSIGKSLPLQ